MPTRARPRRRRRPRESDCCIDYSGTRYAAERHDTQLPEHDEGVGGTRQMHLPAGTAPPSTTKRIAPKD